MNAAQLSRKIARNKNFAGAVLVRQGETDLLRRAYGYANRTWKIKNRPDTRFRIASVGKLFTAAAVLQLIESGKLTFETRVLDCLGLEGTKIPPEATVRHMLTMTSGIADWINEDAEDFDAEWAKFCREHPLYLLRRDADYLPVFANLEPYGPLGEKHRYNGAGFMLLGLMVEKVTGLGYFDYVRQNIFARAGMTETEFLDLDDVVPNVAEGYIPIKNESKKVIGWRKNYYSTTAGSAADGGSTSTLEDLVCFTRALRQGKLVSSELAREMISPQVVEYENDHPGFQWRYGFGCFVMLDLKDQIVCWGHTGEEDGVSCSLWYYPQQDVDVVILGNQSSCAGKISRDIQGFVLGL